MSKDKNFYRFPDIEQFRNAIHQVTFRATYIGQDEDDQPMHDEKKELPTLNYRGTVKLHGTNAGIVFTPDEEGEYEFHAQSRTSIITPTNDNAGFAAFVHTTPLGELLSKLTNKWFTPISLDSEPEQTGTPVIKVFGEWCGKKIQKGVGITQLDKMFVIFGVKVGNIWLHEEDLAKIKLPEYRIFNICDYPNYKIAIDFNKPKEAAEKMAALVDDVEKECPVAKAFALDVMNNNTAYCDENGKIWFDKSNGFENRFKGELKNIFNKLRIDNPKGILYIKF